jgi:hypothetical protein
MCDEEAPPVLVDSHQVKLEGYMNEIKGLLMKYPGVATCGDTKASCTFFFFSSDLSPSLLFLSIDPFQVVTAMIEMEQFCILFYFIMHIRRSVHSLLSRIKFEHHLIDPLQTSE